MDITYCVQVSEWWKVCGHLGRTLPPDDPVLEQWREKVERMHTSMPTLQLLASRTLQVLHTTLPNRTSLVYVYIHVHVHLSFFRVHVCAVFSEHI